MIIGHLFSLCFNIPNSKMIWLQRGYGLKRHCWLHFLRQSIVFTHFDYHIPIICIFINIWQSMNIQNLIWTQSKTLKCKLHQGRNNTWKEHQYNHMHNNITFDIQKVYKILHCLDFFYLKNNPLKVLISRSCSDENINLYFQISNTYIYFTSRNSIH